MYEIIIIFFFRDQV